jgi:SanA protein
MRHRIFQFFRITLKALLFFLIAVLLIILTSNLIIIFSSQKALSDNLDDLEPHNVAVVLGTSRFLRSGVANPWFSNRIAAAALLYHSGKVNYLILSGDNRTIHYNEPEQMRRELRKHDVPDSVMYLDYAGLRTLDSMVRSREIFGQDSIIIVSQRFHNQRAVFLARAHNINAVGFNAKSPEEHNTTQVMFREVFARVKVFIDLVTKKQPRHLGERIHIHGSPVGEE